jgi:peptidoglycan/xylan/chitin deacetylase (PgdA/CDA1 family)
MAAQSRTAAQPATAPGPGTAAQPATAPGPGTAAQPATAPGPGTAAQPATAPDPGTAAQAGTAPGPGTTARPAATTPALYSTPGPAGLPAVPTVALTFDDGPSPWTPGILAVLRRHRIRATFCMLGDEAQRYPAYAREVVLDGHQLCNHSRDHADLAGLPAPQARREVVAAERQIRDAAGVAPQLFRFPYGSASRTARRVVQGYGLRALSWDVDPKDWTRPPARTIAGRVVRQVRPGSVVLLHDGGGDRSHTAAALDVIITQLGRRGYRFVPAGDTDLSS